MASIRKRGNVWYYRFVDADGIKRERKGCSDRRVTEDLARQTESEAARIKAGLAIKAIRDTGVSLRSIHHYTRAVKGFSRWLWRDGRANGDALVHLTSQNPDADRRRIRRALTADDLGRLIQAALPGPVVDKLAGPDRVTLYQWAMGTGFRANELRTLTPEAFALDADPPTVTVKAAYSKRRREDVQPIRDDLADALRPWLAAKAPGKPLFGKLTKHTADMLKRDLEAAGIPYWDGSGRVADFHCLRHSYVTALAKSNAPVKIVQTLARHSTPTLTLGVYSHVGLYDQAPALDALPDLSRPAPSPEPAALAATGTEGRLAHRQPSDPTGPPARDAGNSSPEGQPISERFAHHLPTGGDRSSRDQSSSDVMTRSDDRESMERETPEKQGV